MDINIDPATTLNNPVVKRYFLEILRSELSEYDKYDMFIKFFELESSLRNEVASSITVLLKQGEYDKDKVDKIVADAGQKIGVWKPTEIIQQTEDSIKRAICALKNEQREDGGWGREESFSWQTAFAVLFLNSARNFDQFASDIGGKSYDKALERGINWLKKHFETWFPGENYSRSVYEISLGIICFHRIGQEDFPHVDKALAKLLSSQNRDGGWDTEIPKKNFKGPRGVRSEVGATSLAIEAIAATRRRGAKFEPDVRQEAVLQALKWLIKGQNPDGSWMDMNYDPASREKQPVPDLNKTCDALRAIQSAKTFNIALERWEKNTDKAVEWILNQEKLIVVKDAITRWGWISSEDLHNLEGSTLSLETLVKIDAIPLPLLATNALWLMRNQHKEEGSKDDGAWHFGFTQRIALALIKFYERIKTSALFEPSNDGK